MPPYPLKAMRELMKEKRAARIFSVMERSF
jgi:hypothetical protein